MNTDLELMVGEFLGLWGKPGEPKIRAYVKALDGFAPALLRGVFARLHREWPHDRAPMPVKVREMASKALGASGELVGFDRWEDVARRRLHARGIHGPDERELHREVVRFGDCDVFDPRVVQESRKALGLPKEPPLGAMPRTERGRAVSERFARKLGYTGLDDPRLGFGRLPETVGQGDLLAPRGAPEMTPIGQVVDDFEPIL